MRRNWSAILFFATTAIVLATALGIAHVADVMQGRQDDLIRELDSTARQLDISREQVHIMDERITELETMLLNLRRMQNICSYAATTTSRGGRQLTVITMPITTPSGFTAARFEQILKGTPLEGIGEYLVWAEETYGINAVVLLAIIIHESGWGSSRLAREKNNLAGLGACDGSEYSAGITFCSQGASIFFLAQLLRDKPGGCLAEIGAWYATDPCWARKVGACMKVIGGAGT